jgi:hypothetical protein
MKETKNKFREVLIILTVAFDLLKSAAEFFTMFL